MTHIYQTDFREVTLAESFVAEAEARWPGSVMRRDFVWHSPFESESVGWREPKWVAEVDGALRRLAVEAETRGLRIAKIKTLSALEL